MAFQNQYSALERALHRVAFSTWAAQTVLSDIETSLFKKKLDPFAIEQPVFITALPRAGTTLLLELCENLDEFASHTYRNMPFLLTPLLWNQLSAGFKRTDASVERAHGDGMEVNVDSPEAFEEVVWRTFWKKHYQTNRITPWGKVKDGEFEKFLVEHFRKILASNADAGQSHLRYISKNNLNISRLNYLRRILPDAVILVVFRDPLQHVESLRRQHVNFLEIHKNDSFAKRYMKAIGHYDFGENLKPVDFDGWLSGNTEKDDTSLSFWLSYWRATYKHILNRSAESVLFLSYDALCNNPGPGMEVLAETLNVKDRATFVSQAQRLRSVKKRTVDTGSVPDELLAAADELHGQLQSKSIV